MSSFSKIPLTVKSFFSRSKAKTCEVTNSDRFDESCVPSNVMLAAAQQHLDGVRPQSKQIRSLIPRLAGAIERKLKPREDPLTVTGEAGESILVRQTGFGRIFRHSAGKQFSVVLKNGQTVARSHREIKTHVLLQSYLKAQYDDPSVSKGEVVHPHDFIRSSPGSAPAKRGAEFARNICDPARRKKADSSESHMLLLAPEGSESEWVSDSAPSRHERSASGSESGSVSSPRSDRQSRSASAPERARAATSPVISNRTEIAAPIPSLLPTSDGQLTAPQARMVRFIEDRLQLLPLEFLDEISREDTVVAGYLAVQAAAMLTKVRPTIPVQSIYAQSAHPDIHVMEVEHCGPAMRPKVRFKDPQRQAAAQRKVGDGSVLQLALLDDLKREIERQNQGMRNGAHRQNGEDFAVLPEGIRCSTPDIPIVAGRDSGQMQVAAGVQHVRTLLATQAGTSLDPSTRLAEIASINPAVAAFCGIADEMLLIKGGGTTEANGNRFPYLDSGDFDDLKPVESNDGRRWYDTFLPGVQRTRENAVGASVWRILDGNEWKDRQSKTEVMAHVAQEALCHIAAQGSVPSDQAIYPLAVYHLLAKAADATVPQYLKDSEQRAHDGANQSRAQANQNRQRIANLQETAAAEREIRAQQEALDFVRERVANRFQLTLTRTPFNREEVTRSSVDTTFTFAPRTGTALDMIRGIQENRLSLTHVRQAISSRLAPGQAIDNRCWLRGSWLSLFSSATPDMLEERYRAMCNASDPRVSGTAKTLQGIASRFKENPVAFLFPAADNKTRIDLVGTAAFLEHEMLADGSGRQPSGHGRGLTTEQALQGIQIGVASCFRFENASIMRELDGAYMGAQASSDLPVTLHRAFNVPALIIEAGRRGTNAKGGPDLLGSQIRVVAPPGTALARFVEEAAANNMAMTEDSAILDELLTRFTDLPIIWLEEGHQEIYLPKKGVQT